MAQKAELVITALQQRIGEIVSNYETQVAVLRAEITELIQEKETRLRQEDEKHLATELYSEKLENLGVE